MQFMPPFTRWLKQQRKTLGLTQAALAQRTHYATITLRKLEEGRLKPSREMALQLADALEVPAESRDDFIAFARGVATRHGWRLLPLAAPALIDRQVEMGEVAGLLMRDDVRLVTLLGPPGVGKTRLAVELGHTLANAFADGVCFVPLAEARHPGDVAPAIATSLGVLAPSHQAAAQALIESLEPIELLLILDNFEHVQDAAGLVGDLLASAPNLTVLATSRAPLNIAAEHRHDVLPLPVPALDGEDAAFLECPSVQLFAQRAQAVKPAFALTPANLRPVAEVCAHLEGLPLAIELAAGRTTMFTPRTLASRLRAHSNDVLAMTSSALRNAPRHHRTLQTTIEWSYQLLDTGAQRIFRHMCVFAGGFTLIAAEAVCGGLPVVAGDPMQIAGDDEAFLRVFETLLNHNLIRQTSAEGDEMRFDMLETLREFARDELMTKSEASLAHESHAAYYAQLADAIFFGRPNREDALWLRRLRVERANLQAALTWRMSHNNIDQELLLSAAVNHAAWAGSLMWGAHAQSVGVEDWLNHIELMALSCNIASAEARAKALHGLAERAIHDGDEPRIDRLHRLVGRFYHQTGIPRMIVLGLYSSAYLAQRRGDATEGIAYFEQAHAMAHRHGFRDFEANALGAKGFLLLSQGDDLKAEVCLQEAVAIHRALGLEWCIGVPLPQCLRLLAFVAQERGDFEAALANLDEARHLFTRYGDMSGEMAALILIGRGHLKQRRHAQALLALRQAAPLCLQWSREWLAVVLAEAAGVKMAMGEMEAAARLAGAASRHAEIMQQMRHPRIHLRDDYDNILDEVRRRLNAKTLAVWNAGAALRDDDAIALVVCV